MPKLLAILLISLSLSFPLIADVAVDPDALSNPVAEARARELMKEIRCLVCQNQSIEDSNAEIAVALRGLVRKQVAAGKNNDEIKEFLRARYGDWVLLKPPLEGYTLMLWASPIAFILIGGIIALTRRQRTNLQPQQASPLSQEEEKALSDLLKDAGQ